MPRDGSVIGVGVDLVDVAALRQLLNTGGDSFASAAWTAAEREDAQGDPERLAARWAGKEAAMKALGSGLGEVSPLDIEVVTDEASGAPHLCLHDSAAKRAAAAGVSGWHVSVAHEGAWAVGFVVAVGSRTGCSGDADPLHNTERQHDE